MYPRSSPPSFGDERCLRPAASLAAPPPPPPPSERWRVKGRRMSHSDRAERARARDRRREVDRNRDSIFVGCRAGMPDLFDRASSARSRAARLAKSNAAAWYDPWSALARSPLRCREERTIAMILGAGRDRDCVPRARARSTSSRPSRATATVMGVRATLVRLPPPHCSCRRDCAAAARRGVAHSAGKADRRPAADDSREISESNNLMQIADFFFCRSLHALIGEINSIQFLIVYVCLKR